MGNDSGIRKKSKQRTTNHNKHAAYPGMTVNTSEVKIESGVLKPLKKVVFTAPQATKKFADFTDPDWLAYDQAAKALDKVGNTSKAAANNAERRFSIAYQRLVKAGKAPQIRRKYR